MNIPNAHISGAVEGLVDEAILKRLMRSVGAEPGPIYGRQGKNYLLQRIAGFDKAAAREPWFVLVDLDRDFDCAPPAKNVWLPNASQQMCFRIAVREVEAWLLADKERIAEFLCVRPSMVPDDPESQTDPKLSMIALARRSRRRAIRQDMVLREGSGRDTGPAYTSRMIEFATNEVAGWRPDRAAKSSDSLRRCIERLEQLVFQ